MAAVSQLLHALKKVGVNKAYRTLEPYLPGWFNSRIAGMSDKYIFKALVIEDEILPQYKKAASYLVKDIGKDALGDYLEFGVCYGTSMGCMSRVLRKKNLDNVRLIGFDSFEGLPQSAAHEDDGKWKPGEFACSIEDATQYLTEHGVDWDRTHLIKGWYSDTLTAEVVAEHNIEKASLIMIDCDIYSSSKQALDFCVPLIKDKSIIFFDDWQPGKNMGEEKAFDEFLAENTHLKAKKFGSYKPSGEIFLVENTLAEH